METITPTHCKIMKCDSTMNNNNNNVNLSCAHQRPERSHDTYINLNMIFYTHVEHSSTKTI